MFLDRAIGKRVVANALTNVNPMIKVELLDDHFAANAPDEDWLKFVGRKGWIAITKDKRIRYRTPALEVIKEERVKLFVFSKGNLSGQEMAQILINAIPKIEILVSKINPPFIITITRSGNLVRVK